MAEENSGFQALIDSVNKSNTSLANVEEHTRNSRRHLLEMKKSVFQMAEITEQLASPDTESRREDVNRQERMIDALENIKGGVAKAGGAGAQQKGAGLGGFLGGLGGGGIGGFLGGAGLGVGAAAGGLGLLAGGGALLLKQLSEFDGEAVKKNILALTEISDELVAKEGSIGKAFGETGLLVAMLTGLGAGLAVFGVGAGINTVVAKFEDPNNPFAESVKNNVITLMSIGDLGYDKSSVAGVSGALLTLGLGLISFGTGTAVAAAGTAMDATVEKFTGKGFADSTVENVRKLLSLADLQFGDAAKVAGALGMLGVGLVAFGVGSAVGSAGELLSTGSSAAGQAAGVKAFTEGQSFGERVKTDVGHLLDIMNHPNATFGSVVGFPLVMGSIGAGLIAFAVGEAATAASGAAAAGTAKIAPGVEMFQKGQSNAERIKKEVEILLSIADKPMGQLATNITGFVATMTAIGGGLAVFAVGETATAISGFVGGASAGDDDSQAARIKKQVDLLLSIGENPNIDKAAVAGTAMKDLGKGLSAFATGEFVGALANAGTAILSFFSGQETPFDKIKALSDDAEDLDKAAKAIGTVADNLKKVVAIKVDKDSMNIKAFAEDLKEAVPIIEGAILGTTEGGVFGIGSTTIEGLSNNAQAFADAKKNLLTLRSALDPEGVGGGSAQSADSIAIEAASVVVSGPITASGNITASGPITAEGGGISPGATGIAEGTSNFKANTDAEAIPGGR